MHRWIDVAEVPLVGRHLAVGVQVAFAQHQSQLLLAEIHINESQGDDVEGQVPGCVPGIFPLVRHGNDVAVVHMVPVVVARRLFASFFERVGAALFEPLVHVIVVELLAPEHARQCLAHDIGLVGVKRTRNDRVVEFIRLLMSEFQHIIEVAKQIVLGGSKSLVCRSLIKLKTCPHRSGLGKA